MPPDSPVKEAELQSLLGKGQQPSTSKSQKTQVYSRPPTYLYTGQQACIYIHAALDSQLWSSEPMPHRCQ